MEVCPTNVIFLSSLVGKESTIHSHKCDWECENEHICGNMYHCRLSGLTHICDQNCSQRILYDNHSCVCRASGRIFLMTKVEVQAVMGFRRKFEGENPRVDNNRAFKRACTAQLLPSPFERAFRAVSPICSPVGDGMDMN